jgi:FkbM family methyltransferase
MDEMTEAWTGAKQLVKRAFFAPGTVRRCRVGPYAGIAFEICPQILRTRMAIFYRAYEPEVATLLASAIRPGMVVYDIGAHVGIHALHAAKLLRGSGVVYAFEPWPENAGVLQRHVRCNPGLAGRLVPVLASVGARAGRSAMVEGGGDGQHRLSRTGEPGGRDTCMVTVDGFAAEHPPAPSLILVDVEGEELAVLLGAEHVLRTARPRLVLEHHGAERRTTLRTHLEGLGYTVTDLGGRHLHAI